MRTSRSSRVMAPLRGARHIDLDDGDAFVPDYRHGFVVLKDAEAEALGEEFISAATSAEAIGESARDELLSEEIGGVLLEQSLEESLDEMP